MQLEELSQSTKLSISHPTGSFRCEELNHPWDNVTSFEAVIIGTFKQRLMWPPYGTRSSTDPVRPMCKSNDAIDGYPQLNFPWGDPRANVLPLNENAAEPIKCESCLFPRDPRKAREDGLPTCDSNYEVVMLDPNGKIVILKATGASKNAMTHYRDWFKRNKAAMFMYTTKLELTSVKNGGKRYADLSLSKGLMTDRNEWVTKYLPLFEQWKAESQTPPSASVAAKPKFTELNM